MKHSSNNVIFDYFREKITDLNFAKIHKKMFSLNFLKKLIHGVTMDVAVNLF